jgi:cell division topological specificity factor
MFEGIINFFKKSVKKEEKQLSNNSKSAAKERLHLVLMQDRANVSADFLELMKQEIIEVIKKYIEVDEEAIDVRLTNQSNEDGTNGAPALYANIPIMNIKNESRKITNPNKEEKPKENKEKNSKEEKNTENTEDTEVKKQEKEIEPKTEPKEEKINKNTSKPKKDVESEKIEQEKE